MITLTQHQQQAFAEYVPGMAIAPDSVEEEKKANKQKQLRKLKKKKKTILKNQKKLWLQKKKKNFQKLMKNG